MGKFVVLEGLDCAGKSTQLREIAEALRSQGKKVVTAINPGATPLGQKLRHLIKYENVHIDPFTRSILFLADNSAFINEILLPALREDAIVLADRSNFISDYPYGTASGTAENAILRMHQILQNKPRIDKLFVFSMPWDKILERLKNKNESKSKGLG